jgi:hypothetical protein
MLFSVCTLVLTMLLFSNLAEAAKRFDNDVGFSKSLVKITKHDNQQTHFAAFEPAPALVRQNFVKDSYKEPRSRKHLMIWNDRIDHNYPFQPPGRAAPNCRKIPLRA